MTGSVRRPPPPSLLRRTPNSTLCDVLCALAGRYTTQSSDPNDAIHLICEDGSTFLASRSLLAAHSSVFAAASDLSDTSHPSSQTSDNESISLSSSTPTGLRFLFAVLTIVGTDPTPRHDRLYVETRRYQPHLAAGDIEVIGEAIECANAYDFTALVDHFVRPMLSCLIGLEPVVGFTLLAIVDPNPRSNLKVYAEQMLRAGISEIPSSFHQVLARFAPEHIDRYRRLYDRYTQAHRDLRSQLRVDEPMTGYWPEYLARKWTPEAYALRWGEDAARSARLAEFAPPRHPCCTFYTWEDNGIDLRRSAADSVYAEITKTGWGPSGCGIAVLLLERGMSCETCARWLSDAFDVSIRRFRASARTYWNDGNVGEGSGRV